MWRFWTELFSPPFLMMTAFYLVPVWRCRLCCRIGLWKKLPHPSADFFFFIAIKIHLNCQSVDHSTLLSGTCRKSLQKMLKWFPQRLPGFKGGWWMWWTLCWLWGFKTETSLSLPLPCLFPYHLCLLLSLSNFFSQSLSLFPISLSLNIWSSVLLLRKALCLSAAVFAISWS